MTKSRQAAQQFRDCHAVMLAKGSMSASSTVGQAIRSAPTTLA
jgi:hypothetical protein